MEMDQRKRWNLEKEEIYKIIVKQSLNIMCPWGDQFFWKPNEGLRKGIKIAKKMKIKSKEKIVLIRELCR